MAFKLVVVGTHTNAGPEFCDSANLMSFSNDSSKEVQFETDATACCCL